MKNKVLALGCKDCDSVVAPSLVLLTEDCHIVLRGICQSCGQAIQVSYRMEKIITLFPTPDPPKVDPKFTKRAIKPPLADPLIKLKDDEFLRSLHIDPNDLKELPPPEEKP